MAPKVEPSEIVAATIGNIGPDPCLPGMAMARHPRAFVAPHLTIGRGLIK